MDLRLKLALTLLLAIGCSSPEPLATKSATKSEQPPAIDRRTLVEQTASKWFSAMKARDVAGLVAMSHDPFFFDREVPVSGANIGALYESVSAAGDFQRIDVESMQVSTLAKWQDAVVDEKTNRVMTSLGLKPDDWLAEVSTRDQAGEHDKAAVFVRFVGDEPKVIAYWD